jgi:hypothetical protein
MLLVGVDFLHHLQEVLQLIVDMGVTVIRRVVQVLSA